MFGERVMIAKKFEEGKFTLDDAIARITREVGVFDEAYFQPKQQGVVGLFVPNGVKSILHDRLLYLQGVDANPQTAQLVRKIREMGAVMGFDERGIAEQENPYRCGLDLSKQLPTKDGLPFFVWAPDWHLIHDIEFLNPIEGGKWMERSTDEISDSRGNAVYGGKGITFFTSLPNSMQTHGLSIHKTHLRDGVDTRLSVDCGYSSFEGFMYSFSFHLKDGKLVAVTDGRNETDVNSALNKIENELAVSPQHLRYYLENSSLTDAHREQVADVLDALSRCPDKDVFELFNAHKPSMGRRLLQGLAGEVKALPDSSSIDVSTLREHFRYVTINGLTTGELRETGLPDDKLVYVSVSFKSQAGKGYHVNYQTEHPTGPYIFLGSKGHKDQVDFIGVEGYLKRAMDLGLDGRIMDRTSDLCNTYKLAGRPTPGSVADDVESIFGREFSDVKVTGMMFKDVYKGTVEKSPLSERLKTREIILAA